MDQGATRSSGKRDVGTCSDEKFHAGQHTAGDGEVHGREATVVGGVWVCTGLNKSSDANLLVAVAGSVKRRHAP